MAILRVYNQLTQKWDPIPYIKGDKGDRGYDVTTVEYEYYSSTSSSETIGGEWSTIMPGYSEGRHIWVRTKTTNTHGEVYTGTPVLATLFNDVNAAELSRRTYETNRVNAETARDTAEGLRDSAEIARASAELLRVSAETSRGNSEVSRANAEAQRVSAESSRVLVEGQRAANEEQRIANEDARIAAQGRYPIVRNSTWWVWSKEDDDYVDTEVTAVGTDGVGIASISKTGTVDLVDTYTITFDNGSTTTFTVTNGEKGQPGQDGISPTITVTEISGGHEVAVTDAEGTQTFDVLDGEVTEDALEERLIDKADVITSSASGEIVTIADGGNDMPVVDLSVSLLPVQDLHGQSSPYPAGGGRNIMPNIGNNSTFTNVAVSYDPVSEIYTLNGTTNNPGNLALANITPSDLKWTIGEKYTISCSVVSGSFTLGEGTGITYALSIFNSNNDKYIRTSTILVESNLDGCSATGNAFESTGKYQLMIQCWRTGTVFNNLKIRIQIESGTTKTAWSPYSNICPISGWDGMNVYHSGKNLFDESEYKNLVSNYEYISNSYRCRAIQLTPYTTYTVSQNAGTTDNLVLLIHKQRGVNGSGFLDCRKASDTKTFTTNATGCLYIGVYSGTDETVNARLALCKVQIELGSSATSYEAFNGNTYPMSWETEAGTVYGGSLDVTSGVLTVTDAMITSYNGETLPSTWISDRDVYAPGTTPTTGAQVVYKLATPTTYQLTPTQISTLLGTNNFWSNSNGSIDLEYRADTKLYIQQLTKPSEDDMVANANIASGRFFMVGNRLMLSTTAIAQGEQIVVGTNCSEVSLADALNQINA